MCQSRHCFRSKVDCRDKPCDFAMSQIRVRRPPRPFFDAFGRIGKMGLPVTRSWRNTRLPAWTRNSARQSPQTGSAVRHGALTANIASHRRISDKLRPRPPSLSGIQNGAPISAYSPPQLQDSAQDSTVSPIFTDNRALMERGGNEFGRCGWTLSLQAATNYHGARVRQLLPTHPASPGGREPISKGT